MKTMIKYAIDVSENAKNGNIVNKAWGVHELTDNTQDVCNI